MLEIIFLFWFGRKLAAMAREKGRTGAWWLLGVGLWVGGEVFGAVVATLLEFEGLGMYGAMLGCAIAGALVAYGIVSSLAPTELAEDNLDFVR